jgi:3,5-epimerase/4-reductase
VKGYTDLLLQQTNALSLRIRMPIVKEEHPKNFITKLLTYNKIHSVLNSMTDLDAMIPVAIEMMKLGEKGTYNFTNIDATHDELLQTYKREVDALHTWELVEGSKLDIKAKRSNTLLDTSKLKEFLTIHYLAKHSMKDV